MFSVAALARQTHAPTARHEIYLKRLLRYLAGTMKFGIMYYSSQPLTPSSLQVHVDADWGVARKLASQLQAMLSASTVDLSSGRVTVKLLLLCQVLRLSTSRYRLARSKSLGSRSSFGKLQTGILGQSTLVLPLLSFTWTVLQRCPLPVKIRYLLATSTSISKSIMCAA